MMEVASNLSWGLALALTLVGCAGNVVEGLPRDGSISNDPAESVEETADGGTDGRKDAARDSAVTPAKGNDDGSTARQDASSPAPADAGMPSTPADAGQPPSSGTALNPGALARPADNGRTYSSTPADWMGSPRCRPDQVTFCDDFESQAVGGTAGPAWSVEGAAVTTSDDELYRGAKSMRFGPPSGMPGQMKEVQTFPLLKDKIFGRMFVYFFTPLPTAPSDAHWTLVEVGGSDNSAQVRLGGQIDPSRGNKNYFGVGSDGGDSGDWHTKGLEPESEVKQNTWTCLEWMFDGNANETRVWINNVEQLSLHTTASNYRAGDAEGGKQFIHPTYDHLKVGWWVYQSNTTPDPAVVFIDELILDDDQIGCSL